MTHQPDQTKSPATPAAAPKALGRGLAALINTGVKQPGSSSVVSVHANTPVPEVAHARLELVDLKLIHPNPHQPRKVFNEERIQELSESLKEQGLVQPIVVRRQGERFEIIAGERRWRAAKLAQFEKIPVIVRSDKDTTVSNDLASLVENLQREQLSPLELAAAYDRIMGVHKMTQDQVAQKVGVSRVAVANTLRLLKLPKEVKEMLASGKITEGHARSLLALETEKQMGEVAQKIVMKTWSVREAEQEVRSIKSHSTQAATNAAKAEEQAKMASLEEELRRVFGTKVSIKRGTIEIYYSGPDSLHRIVHQIRGLSS